MLACFMVGSAVDRMMVLALVPFKYVPTLFGNLENELSEEERNDLNPLFKYFTEFWLSRISMWNLSGIVDRRNNYSEGTKNKITITN